MLFPRSSRAWLTASVAGYCLFSSACKSSNCSEERIAIDLTLTNPDMLDIEKVTAELEDERECGTFDPGTGFVYTCWEQGGGTYTVRVYVGDDVIYSEEIEVENEGCHIKERVSSEIDLTGLGSSNP